LDGIYVLRTNVAGEQLDDEQTVLAYIRLATVERARAHVFLAMLAYYVE
jgi:hypothetical protein